MARYFYILLAIACFPVFWYLTGDQEQRIENIQARSALKPLFRECAQEHALFARAMDLDDVDTLSATDRFVLLGCVAEAAADQVDSRVALMMLKALVEDYPALGEPAAAPYLLPALYKAESFYAAEYLLENTAADTGAALAAADEQRFKGLTLPQYHAFYRRLNVADLMIRHGAVLAPPGSRFRHWIYDNQMARLNDPKLNEFLEKHGIPIDEQDARGRTVLLRAMQDGRDKVAAGLMNLGADPTVKDQRNETASDLLDRARGVATMAMPSPDLPARLAAISPAQYSGEQNLRADPLPLDARQTLFLYDDDRRTRAERWDWLDGQRDTVRLPLPARDAAGKPLYYATLNTADGLWVLGPISVLVTPGGEVIELTEQRQTDRGDYRVATLSLPTAAGNPRVVALGDGSLLVLGATQPRDGRLSAHRLTLRDRERGVTELRALASPAELRPGAAAARLADGRVLVVGGAYRHGRRAWLYDPRADAWRATGELHSPRAWPAIAALPDGRAFVAGNGGRADRRADSVYSAELWDPGSGRWSVLPGLPLSYGVDARRARGPSAAVLADGSLVVGGGLHDQVFRLRAEGRSFAAEWTLAGPVPRQRVSAGLQALEDGTLAVLGGWGPAPGGRCCRSRAGGDVLDPAVDGGALPSVGLRQREGAVAHRGGRSFIAGGWDRYAPSARTVQASAMAELLDRDRDRVERRLRLPGPLLYGRARWLDDDRILLKSVAFDPGVRSGLRGIDERALETEYRGYLALYRLSTGRWQVLEDARIARAELAGLVDNEAILVGPGVNTWSVDLDKWVIRELRERVALRAAAVSRVSRDGRVIVAGGSAQAFYIQAADVDCMASDCPLRWFAAGGLAPADRYEIRDPRSRRWRFSAIKRVAAEEAVIRQDGSVVTLGWRGDEWLIEASSADGGEWRFLAHPGDAGDGTGPDCGRPDGGERPCRLAVGTLPDGQGDRVFLVVRRADRGGEALHSMWQYADEEDRWLAVARDLTGPQLNETIALAAAADGRVLSGAFFNTDRARLWWE